MLAVQKIGEQNYPVDNLMMFVNFDGYRAINKWIIDKGAQFNNKAETSLSNGSIGGIAGIKNIVVSKSVTSSYALICVPKTCGTWRALEPLKTITKQDEGVSLTIRSWEQGVTQLTDPKAVTLISAAA